MIGALAGIIVLTRQADENELPAELRVDDWRELDDARIEAILRWIWQDSECPHAPALIRLVQGAMAAMRDVAN